MNYRLKIQYDGTRYKGWQRQKGTEMTIQGKLERVLSLYAGRELEIQGAGRTDAGVHALEQVANVHFPGECAPEPGILKDYLNEYLPEDIRVISADRAGDRFHSRLNAQGKRYGYHIIKYGRDCVFQRKYAWKAENVLDINKMKKAAGHLLGTHDFQSFCSRASKKKSTVRTIHTIDIQETEDEVYLIYEGNGFLHNMVRILTGTLVDAGSGKLLPEEIPEILEKRERRFAGETAPAKGLFLEKVYYG